jgi:GNAT superfamily N-acetyltransferase
MQGVEFQFVWRRRSESIDKSVGEFWLGLGAISVPEIQDRLNELCAVASTGGKTVATSTARIVQSSTVRERLLYYRTLVAPEYRKQKLAQELCAFPRNAFAQWARENPEHRLKGLLIVFQAREFAELDRLPVAKLAGLDFIFVGHNNDGERMRVVWFDGVVLGD